MNPWLSLSATILMSITPSLLFLGLFKGLRHGQQQTLITNASNRAGVEANEITLKQSANAVFGGGSITLIPARPQTTEHSSTHSSGVTCPNCHARNTRIADYCHTCTTKLSK